MSKTWEQHPDAPRIGLESWGSILAPKFYFICWHPFGYYEAFVAHDIPSGDVEVTDLQKFNSEREAKAFLETMAALHG